MRLRGLTLIELLLVVALLVALASAVLPRLNAVADDASTRATLESMRAVRNASCGTLDDPGFVNTVGSLPNTIDDLFTNHTGAPAYNPLTKKGYRANGYLQSNGAVFSVNTTTGFTAAYCYNDGVDAAVLDGWNRPLVIQTSPNNPKLKRLISAGPDGFINTLVTDSYPDPLHPVNDDIVVSLNPEAPTSW